MYTRNEIAQLIGNEIESALQRDSVSIENTQADHDRYEIQLDLGNDEHMLFFVTHQAVSEPFSVVLAASHAGFKWDFMNVPPDELPIEAKKIYDQSWERFRASINHFVQEVVYRVEQHFDWQQLQEIVQSLTESEIVILRELKERDVIDLEWLGLPMHRVDYDNLLPHDQRLQVLDRLCDLQLAELHDALGSVAIVMIGRGAEALTIIDAK